MRAELLSVRAQLIAALATVDNLLRGSTEETDTASYRTAPGGPLSDTGIAEMYRRFEAGEPDAIISRGMGVSVQGIQKRRTIWKRGG